MADRTGRMFLAIMLIIFGFFFSAVLYVPGWLSPDVWWPAFILVPGLTMLVVGLAGIAGRSRGMIAMVIPGCIVSTVGGILLFCNVTNRWESWAYAWTLIPAAVGLGIWTASHFGVGDAGAARAGRWLMLLGASGFVLFGAFFEGLIFGGVVSRYWPAALILLGVVVLLSSARRDSGSGS